MGRDVRGFFVSLSEMFKTPTRGDDNAAILLENVKNEIRDIRNSIDSVNDDILLDMYLYRLKTAEAQYRHLLKMAKEGQQKKTG
jgi:hypothetical protein